LLLWMAVVTFTPAAVTLKHSVVVLVAAVGEYTAPLAGV